MTSCSQGPYGTWGLWVESMENVCQEQSLRRSMTSCSQAPEPFSFLVFASGCQLIDCEQHTGFRGKALRRSMTSCPQCFLAREREMDSEMD